MGFFTKSTLKNKIYEFIDDAFKKAGELSPGHYRDIKEVEKYLILVSTEFALYKYPEHPNSSNILGRAVAIMTMYGTAISPKISNSLNLTDQQFEELNSLSLNRLAKMPPHWLTSPHRAVIVGTRVLLYNILAVFDNQIENPHDYVVSFITNQEEIRNKFCRQYTSETKLILFHLVNFYKENIDIIYPLC